MDASGPAALACCACSQHEACGGYQSKRATLFLLNTCRASATLRQERDQIWAEVVELERAGRLKYETEMRARKIPVNLDDAIYPDIMLLSLVL